MKAPANTRRRRWPGFDWVTFGALRYVAANVGIASGTEKDFLEILSRLIRLPNDRVRAHALWEGSFGYDRYKYVEMQRGAFEPVAQSVSTRERRLFHRRPVIFRS